VNSHDSTSALHVYFGLFRIACLNGIIAGDNLGHLRVVHSERFIPSLEEGLDALLSRIPTFIEQVVALQSKVLSDASFQELASYATKLRLGNKELTFTNDKAYTRARRLEDTSGDAFTQFNKVQEILLRGGLSYLYKAPVKDEHGSGFDIKRGTTRAVSSVSETVRLNQALYNKMLELLA
jgi:hypothetical protein